ncbi:MAG: HPr family phosphocarrier protein [Rhodobacteraceae bacterium]|nr:HPr family phosphocarrier protein [Paracoccaceae bacterium]
MCSESEVIRRKLELINLRGLHARASAKFVEIVESHEADATVSFGGSVVSGESIMGLLTLAAPKGSVISLETSGPRALDLADALEELVANRFNEAY